MDDQKPMRPAQAELTPSEARLEAVLESISDGFYALDREWRYVLFNRAAEQYFGVKASDLLGKVMWEVFPQGVGTDFERFCRGAMDEGLITRFETPSRLRPDRYVELKIAPLRDEGVCVSLTDITERKRADSRAVEILETFNDGFFAVDREFRFTYVNARMASWWRKSKEQLIGKNAWEVFPQAVGGSIYSALRHAAESGEPVKLEALGATMAGWVDASIHPSVDGGLAVYVRDVTERKRAEAARELLMREVDHRSRNMLAVVQSIVQLTRSADLESYKATVIGRISALARAQGSLAMRRWEGASLRQLVTEELATVGKARAYALEGPAMTLPPERVQPLSMIFHELATNAAKYGAFSTEAGQVEVRWSLDGDHALTLTWTETGGPPVREPARRGFGSRLIVDLLRQVEGKASFDWNPDGLTVVMTIPPAAAPPAA
jgi:PAS domain S-box-containing protein